MPQSAPAKLRANLRVTGFGLAVLALGLLIWARLLLVTSHQRTAIAVPAESLVRLAQSPDDNLNPPLDHPAPSRQSSAADHPE